MLRSMAAAATGGFTVTANVPTTGKTNAKVTFSARGSGGRAPYKFAWTSQQKTKIGATVTFTYLNAGQHTWKLLATDAAGHAVNKTGTITIGGVGKPGTRTPNLALTATFA